MTKLRLNGQQTVGVQQPIRKPPPIFFSVQLNTQGGPTKVQGANNNGR